MTHSLGTKGSIQKTIFSKIAMEKIGTTWSFPKSFQERKPTKDICSKVKPFTAPKTFSGALTPTSQSLQPMAGGVCSTVLELALLPLLELENSKVQTTMMMSPRIPNTFISSAVHRVERRSYGQSSETWSRASVRSHELLRRIGCSTWRCDSRFSGSMNMK